MAHRKAYRVSEVTATPPEHPYPPRCKICGEQALTGEQFLVCPNGHAEVDQYWFGRYRKEHPETIIGHSKSQARRAKEVADGIRALDASAKRLDQKEQ